MLYFVFWQLFNNCFFFVVVVNFFFFFCLRVLVHLSRAGADVSIYAPDIPQMHVLNHAKGEVAESEIR